VKQYTEGELVVKTTGKQHINVCTIQSSGYNHHQSPL